MFWVGVGLFFGLHVMPSFPKLRDGLIGRLGENPYKGVYSLIVLMGMVLIVMGYPNLAYQELWASPVWARHLAFTVMPIVLILMVASHLKGYIKKKAKHPMMVGVLLWSVVHLIANGDRAALYLFGAFALFSVYSIVSSTRRGLAPTYESPNRTHDFIAIGAGGVLFAGILWGHGFLT